MQINCHLSRLIEESARVYGDRVALQYRDYNRSKWIGVSWNQFADRVHRSARSLVHLGVGVQDRIAVFSQNKPESLFVEFGAFRTRAVCVPFYATTSGAQVQFMMNDAEIRLIFVGEQQQYDTVWSVLGLCHKLEHIVIFDPEVKRHKDDRLSLSFNEFLALGDRDGAHESEVQRRVNEAEFSDMANILYTSGTTGQSKGVIVLHSQYHFTFQAHTKVYDLSPDVCRSTFCRSATFSKADGRNSV